MRAIRFFAILSTISLSNHEIKRAKPEPNMLGGLTFLNNDFTDYLEDQALKKFKRDTNLSDKALTSLGDIESKYKSNQKLNPKEAKTLLNTTSQVTFSNKNQILPKSTFKTPNILPKIIDTSLSTLIHNDKKTVFSLIGEVNAKKSKALVTVKPEKRDATLLNLKSIENENIESVFEIIEKLNPEKVKVLLRAKREASPTTSTSIENEDNIESVFEIIEKHNPEKGKELLRTKRVASSTTLSSIEDEDIKSIFRRIEKLYPEKAKELLRAARKVSFSALAVDEDYNESTFRRSGKKLAAASKLQHDVKVEGIMKFMEPNYMTTNYIYEEVQRIKKQGKIRDKLRLLVLYLEQENHEKLKDSFLKCYNARRKIDKPRNDIWKNRITNNVVINTFKDPYNDGHIN